MKKFKDCAGEGLQSYSIALSFPPLTTESIDFFLFACSSLNTPPYHLSIAFHNAFAAIAASIMLKLKQPNGAGLLVETGGTLGFFSKFTMW